MKCAAYRLGFHLCSQSSRGTIVGRLITPSVILTAIRQSSSSSSTPTTGTYYPENHPYIVKGNYDNMYTQNAAGTLKPELAHHSSHKHKPGEVNPTTGVVTAVEEQDRVDPPSFIIPSSSGKSSVQAHIDSRAHEMEKAIFFYHESNPHLGLLDNTQYLLYEHYQLVGPVKSSWFKILVHCPELVDLLFAHLHQSDAKQEPTVGSLVAIIEHLSKQESLSACKYKSTVTENKLQFRRSRMTKEELIVLEVIAQFAGHRDYEVVNW